MNLVPELGEKRDYPVTLTAIDYEDVCEGDYDTRRTLVYNLSFMLRHFYTSCARRRLRNYQEGHC